MVVKEVLEKRSEKGEGAEAHDRTVHDSRPVSKHDKKERKEEPR